MTTDGESLESWAKRWESGNECIAFHNAEVHKMLPRFVDQMTGGKPSCRVFVPLCGKSVDMLWLWERGHEIVGVEAIDQAVQDFFTENKVKHTVTTVEGLPGAKLYQNEDGRIKIYKSDLFELTKKTLGTFDCIWDRGSLVAINPCDRLKYCDMMKSLLDGGACNRILMETAIYDPKEDQRKNKAPFSLSEAETQSLYGPQATISLLNTVDMLTEDFVKAGMTWLNACMILITLSQ